MTVALRRRVRWSSLALLLASSTACGHIVAVVSAKSTVVTLTRAQVADIFLGRSRRFPDGNRAVPIDQPPGSLARAEFYVNLVGKTSAQLEEYWSKIIFTGRGQPPQSAPTSAEVKRWLTENPAAIGYIESDLVDATVKVVF